MFHIRQRLDLGSRKLSGNVANSFNSLAEEQREYLEIIKEESLRLSQMATNVLNMTKIENQTILTDKTTYDLQNTAALSLISQNPCLTLRYVLYSICVRR